MTHSICSRSGASLAAALLLCLVAAGCADDSDPTPTASDRTTEASSAESSSTPSESTEATPSDDPAPRTLEGDEVDPAEFVDLVLAALQQGTSARISMTQSASSMEATGIASYGTPLALSIEIALPALGEDPIQARLVDNVIYMQMPMLGDKFLAFDLDDPSNPLASISDLLDPSSQAELIAKSVEKVVYVGQEELRGETMDRYEVVQDPSAMLEQLGLPEGAPMPDLPESVTLSYWLDGDGFVRQAVTDMGSLGTSTQTFDDWGLDVVVEAPTPDQIMEMPAQQAG